jgi:predicted DNA-binding transcriptional regulator AlpA
MHGCLWVVGKRGTGTTKPRPSRRSRREASVRQVHEPMPRQSALPANLPPRLVNREAAADYLSVSDGTFDLMVQDGRMPKPKRLSVGRIAWDVRELDAAVDALPHEGDPADADHTWEDIDAAKTAAAR